MAPGVTIPLGPAQFTLENVGKIVQLVAFAVADILASRTVGAPVAILIGVGLGLVLGLVNGVLVAVLRVPAIIATLGTFSILEGASLLLRDHPEGPINGDVIDALNTSIIWKGGMICRD